MSLVADGIHRLSVPTPFAIGAVNAYLIEGAPLTLVDNGPNVATSLVELEKLLGEIGYRLEDLELLIITHQHIDHLGLTRILAERSGADVACLDLAAGYIEDFEESAAANDDYAQALMREHGVDLEVATALRTLAGVIGTFGASATITRRLRDGDEVRLGDRTMRVLHRPGHSPSDTVFHDEAAQLLIGGDHLLGKVSSNALVTRPLEPYWDGARLQPLLSYRASLRATREQSLALVLPGHGDPVTNHRRLIDDRLQRNERRAAQLLELLGKGPRTAHQLATEIFGPIAITQAYLALSEILGHLDLLIAAGSAREDTGGATNRFLTCD